MFCKHTTVPVMTFHYGRKMCPLPNHWSSPVFTRRHRWAHSLVVYTQEHWLIFFSLNSVQLSIAVKKTVSSAGVNKWYHLPQFSKRWLFRQELSEGNEMVLCKYSTCARREENPFSHTLTHAQMFSASSRTHSKFFFFLSPSLDSAFVCSCAAPGYAWNRAKTLQTWWLPFSLLLIYTEWMNALMTETPEFCVHHVG